MMLGALSLPVFYFVMHVRYLYSGFINYDYNMKVNVFFGKLLDMHKCYNVSYVESRCVTAEQWVSNSILLLAKVT